MKQLIKDLKEHFYCDFEKYSYLYIVSLAIILVSINYSFEFERRYIRIYFGKPNGHFIYFLYYSIPFYIGILPFLAIRKQIFKLKKLEFWVKSIILLLILGIFTSFDHNHTIVRNLNLNENEIKYAGKLISFLKRIIPFLIIIFILYWIYDKNTKEYYGLRIKGLNYQAFIYLLLLLLPFVLIASFLPGIQSYYPQFKYWNYSEVFSLNKFEMNIIFLLCYAIDFVSVELFFRGAMVIGFISILGREAILPAAIVYLVIHFGKPLGETISSFFGAYILGVIAFKYKNIFGGIILHISLAWLMEFAAIFQHFRLK